VTQVTTTILLALGLVLGACSSDDDVATPTATTVDPPAIVDPPTIVVTTNVLGDVVGAVVGDDAEVIVVQAPDTDPSTVVATPEQAELLAEADLVVANGLGLEVGLAPDLTAREAAGEPTITIAPELSPLPTPDGTGEGDPHVWMDPDRMAAAAFLLADEISAATGLDQAALTERAGGYEGELRNADAEVQAAVDELTEAQRTYTDSARTLRYFSERYGFADTAGPDVADLRVLSLGAPGSATDTYAGMLESFAEQLSTRLRT